MKKFSALAILLFGGALLSVGVQEIFSFSGNTKNQQASAIGAITEEIRAPKDPYLNIALEARAVYVYNLKTKEVFFAKNENEKHPLASVTKLMTALVAREHMGESVVLTTLSDDISAEGDSGLRTGERWRLGDILDVLLLVSSNDAAHAVARFVGGEGRDGDTESFRTQFIAMMNTKARTLGFSTMEFFNEAGLDVNPSLNGGYGSAREVALLMSELWNKYPETIEVTARKDARIYSQDNIAHILPNTNEIVGQIPGLVASKTGFTDISGGNLAVIFDRGVGEPIAIVVLGSTYKGRFDDMQKLVGLSR